MWPPCRRRSPRPARTLTSFSEPGQVNFACAKATRQVLWVFALLTSDNNPRFADTKTRPQGLEPITPAQGGQVAASLNLHHPYDPADPIDSIAVAARAINDIIGGATLTGTDGNPVVQSGLEGSSRNCLRYTGSGLVTSRQGFPDVCTGRITSPEAKPPSWLTSTRNGSWGVRRGRTRRGGAVHQRRKSR